MYNDTYKPATKFLNGEECELLELEHHILLNRRKEFGMTQQEVADSAHIQLRQYTRLESGERTMSGASLRIALSICRVLKLDPFRFVPDFSIYRNN